MANHNSLEMGRKYNSQAELYPPVSEKERLEFGGIKMEPVTIDRQNSSMSKALTTGLNTFAATIGESKPNTRKLVDQIVRIARSAGMNVDKVHPGDIFEIKAKTLLVTMSNGKKLAIPLSKEGIPENTLETGAEVLVKREQIKDSTRQEWEDLLEADMTKILYDSMLARGITFTKENRLRIWSKLSATGNAYVKAMEAHGSKRLIAALDADKDFLAKKYTGSAIQHLAMIEYLRTYGLDAFIDSLEEDKSTINLIAEPTFNLPTPKPETPPAPEKVDEEIGDASVRMFVDAAKNPEFKGAITIDRTAVEENGLKFVTGTITLRENGKPVSFPLKIDVTTPIENKLQIQLYGYKNAQDDLGKVNAVESLKEATIAYNKAIEAHRSLSQKLPTFLAKAGYTGISRDNSKEATEGIYEYSFTAKGKETILLSVMSEPASGNVLSITTTIGDRLLGDGTYSGTLSDIQPLLLQAITENDNELTQKKQFESRVSQFTKDFDSAVKKHEIVEINKNPSLIKFSLGDRKEIQAEVKINGLAHTMNLTVFLGIKGAANKDVSTFAEALEFVKIKAPEFAEIPPAKNERSEAEVAAEKLVTEALTDGKTLPQEFKGTPTKSTIGERDALEMVSSDQQKHMRIAIKPDADGRYFGMYQSDSAKEPVIGYDKDLRKLITVLLNKAKTAESLEE